MAAKADAAGRPEPRPEVARADSKRPGNLLHAHGVFIALGELVHLHDESGSRRRLVVLPKNRLSLADSLQEYGEQQAREVALAAGQVSLHQLAACLPHHGRDHERPEPQRLERCHIDHVESDEEPPKILPLGLDIVVKLERKHEEALLGIEADRTIINGNRDRRLKRQDEHESVMKSPSPLGPVQIRRGPSAEAYNVVGKRERRRALAVQRPQRRRKQVRQFLEREDTRVT